MHEMPLTRHENIEIPKYGFLAFCITLMSALIMQMESMFRAAVTGTYSFAIFTIHFAEQRLLVLRYIYLNLQINNLSLPNFV